VEIKSKAQAGFLARIGFGKGKPGKGGPTKAKARKMLAENKGFRMADLPDRAPERKPQRAARRSNSRSGRR
jgi:hypothetical protein